MPRYSATTAAPCRRVWRSPEAYSGKLPEPLAVSKPAMQTAGIHMQCASVPGALHVVLTPPPRPSARARFWDTEASARPTPPTPPEKRACPDTDPIPVDRGRRVVALIEEGVPSDAATRARPYEGHKRPHPARYPDVLQVRRQRLVYLETG